MPTAKHTCGRCHFEHARTDFCPTCGLRVPTAPDVGAIVGERAPLIPREQDGTVVVTTHPLQRHDELACEKGCCF